MVEPFWGWGIVISDEDNFYFFLVGSLLPIMSLRLKVNLNEHYLHKLLNVYGKGVLIGDESLLVF